MSWQSVVEAAAQRYIIDIGVRETVLASIKGTPTPVVAHPRDRRLVFRAVAEDRPGPALQALYERGRGAYRAWYLRDGEGARPSLAASRAALEQHMPELVAPWSELVDAVGGDDLDARILTLYDPPPLISGCSQAVLRGEPALVRNYDYDVDLFDAVVLSTRLATTRVIGTADQLWGLLDGINDRGLAVSFTFGGRRCSGPGFSIPLVIRHLLERCATADEAAAELAAIPVQGAYNVTLVDADGRHATVFVAPGESPRVTARRAATNHQETIDWPEHARWTKSVKRLEQLERLLERDGNDVPDGMLEPPLRSADFDAGFGTLYTALYRPAAGTVEYRWPGATWRHSLDELGDREFVVDLEP